MSDERPAVEHAEPHVGRWPDPWCPRCGSANKITVTVGTSGSGARSSYCGLCRLPDPTPEGWMLRSHDDPSALI